ncbi:MAG: hypothetical protein JRI23_02540 [Deltaproteobacteria bacterium]|jgi:serine/threonine-protein kinase|nr:hypothetical protein [Deltaproteobacteria bacterium]MBW2530373.1 hypothetical protein [Deltaproteobacteria bacterium]
MLDHERFIEKAAAETGQDVLAHAEARRTDGDDQVGSNGLLCAVSRGLCFVEESILDPGEVTTWDRKEIVEAQLNLEVLDASLRIHTADGEVLFEHIDTEVAVDLVEAARLKLRTGDSEPPAIGVSEAPSDEEELSADEADDETDDGFGSDEESSHDGPPPAPRRRRSDRPPPPPKHAARPEAAEAPPAAPAPRRGLIVAIAALVLIGAIIPFMLQSTGTGQVTVSVRSGGAEVDAVEIFVDGQKRCEFSPCTLELEPGHKQIRATKGNARADRQVKVDRGGKYQVSIDLGPGLAKAAKAPKATTATLELYGSTPDVEVFVNGERKGELPLVLLDVKPGQVRLMFKGGEDYRSTERTVKLEAGKTLVIDDINLPLRMVAVTFVIDDAVTSAELVRLGHPEQRSPLEPQGGLVTRKLDTSHRWAVRAKGQGATQLYLPISFADGEPTKEISVAFAEEPDPDGAETAPTASPGVEQESKLVLNSIPPSQVMVDGRSVGNTPVGDVQVAPGQHTVIFIHPEKGRKARSVAVKPGETKVVTVKF